MLLIRLCRSSVPSTGRNLVQSTSRALRRVGASGSGMGRGCWQNGGKKSRRAAGNLQLHPAMLRKNRSKALHLQHRNSSRQNKAQIATKGRRIIVKCVIYST